MDKAYVNALKHKQKLQEELTRVEMFLAQWERFAGTNADHHETPGEVENPVKSGNESSRSRESFARPQDIAKAAARLIRDAGKPLSRSEVVEGLEARGMRINSPDKPRYVGTILWRNKDTFVNEGSGYTVVADETARSDDFSDLLGGSHAEAKKPGVFD